jgi:ribosome-associated protein
LTEAAEIAIRGEMIRLGQLLKLAGAVDGGGEAKALLAGGAVTVNGRPELRRGRQLHVGDLVSAGAAQWRVTGAPTPPAPNAG